MVDEHLVAQAQILKTIFRLLEWAGTADHLDVVKELELRLDSSHSPAERDFFQSCIEVLKGNQSPKLSIISPTSFDETQRS